MATYNFSPVPAWGQAGSFARIGAKKSTTFPCTLPGGGNATVVQGGATKVGYVESDANGLIPAFTTTDVPSVVVDFGIGQLTIHSLEAITAGASSAAAAAASAADAEASQTAAAASQTAAASSAAAAQAAFGNLVIDITAPAYGAVGDGTTDDAAAIQSAIDAAPAGSAILFPHTGSGASYKITTGLTVSTANLRFVGTGRDYAAQITGATASMTMLTVKAPGFVCEDVMLVGDGGTNGVGATVNGIDLFGDTSANCDATIGGTLKGLAQPVKVRGRNAVVNSMISNCLNGVQWDGIDAAYHTGPGADDKRGNEVHSKFHNIGTSSMNACIEITDTAKVVSGLVSECFHDSGGLGKFVKATGTSSAKHNRITFRGNKHTESSADLYDLTYVINSTISDVDASGLVGTTPGGRGIVLNNCDDVQVRDFFGLQLGGTGLYARNCTGLDLADVKFRAIGWDTATTAHGFDIDSTNTGVTVDGIAVNGADGYGWSGSPAGLKRRGYQFANCTTGRISSTTFLEDAVFIPASQLTAVSGTPALTGAVGVATVTPQAMQFDASTTEQVTAFIPRLPTDWGSFDVVVLWAATNAGTGNVMWQAGTAEVITGAVPAAPTMVASGAVAVSGTAATVQSTTFGTGITNSGNPRALRLYRDASNAGDTYAADAQVFGVQLVRAS